MSATAKKTTLTFTEPQLALLRQIVFRDLRQSAEVLSEHADDAAGGSNDVNGEDAEGMYRLILGNTCELLDVIGWSTRGDAERLVEWDRERRAAAKGGV